MREVVKPDLMQMHRALSLYRRREACYAELDKLRDQEKELRAEARKLSDRIDQIVKETYGLDEPIKELPSYLRLVK